MINELNISWKDLEFLSLLSSYESELSTIYPKYPTGQTITFLDVPGIHTYVARENMRLVGFIVVEHRDEQTEIHELYVVPQRRNGKIFRELLSKAMLTKHPVVFNVFKTNERTIRLVDLSIRRYSLRPTDIADHEVWGVLSTHYEMEPNNPSHHTTESRAGARLPAAGEPFCER